LSWYRKLIQLRRSEVALRDGRTVMLDAQNASVLSYVRVDTHKRAVLVSLNMSSTAQTISLDLSDAGLSASSFKTLMASPEPISASRSAHTVTLPPFGAWVASVR
jgi:alpha-glucosidase